MAPYDIKFATKMTNVIIDRLETNDMCKYRLVFQKIGAERYEYEKEVKTRTFEDIVKPQFENLPFDITYDISLNPASQHGDHPKPCHMAMTFTFKLK